MLHKSMNWDLDDHNKSDGNNSTSRLRFISFFINNKLGHFKQLTTVLKMIQKVFNK